MGLDPHAPTNVDDETLERWDRRIGMFLLLFGGYLSMRFGGYGGAAAGFLCAIGGMFRGMAK